MDAVQRPAHLQDALTLLESGHTRRAERVCRELLSHDPGDVEALLLLGLAIGARGKAAAAAPITEWHKRAAATRILAAIWRAC